LVLAGSRRFVIHWVVRAGQKQGQTAPIARVQEGWARFFEPASDAA